MLFFNQFSIIFFLFLGISNGLFAAECHYDSFQDLSYSTYYSAWQKTKVPMVITSVEYATDILLLKSTDLINNDEKIDGIYKIIVPGINKNNNKKALIDFTNQVLWEGKGNPLLIINFDGSFDDCIFMLPPKNIIIKGGHFKECLFSVDRQDHAGLRQVYFEDKQEHKLEVDIRGEIFAKYPEDISHYSTISEQPINSLQLGKNKRKREDNDEGRQAKRQKPVKVVINSEYLSKEEILEILQAIDEENIPTAMHFVAENRLIQGVKHDLFQRLPRAIVKIKLDGFAAKDLNRIISELKRHYGLLELELDYTPMAGSPDWFRLQQFLRNPQDFQALRRLEIKTKDPQVVVGLVTSFGIRENRIIRVGQNRWERNRDKEAQDIYIFDLVGR